MRRWLILILLGAMLTGCQMQKGSGESVGRPVIQQIVVTTQQGIKNFTNEEKMQEILHKIRRLGQKFTPEVDPESLPGTVVSVELLRSDGTRVVYAIKNDRFVRQGSQPWQQGESRRILALRLLLEELPADG